MPITTVGTPSVTVLDSWRDQTVAATFRAVDPCGIVDVVMDPEPADDGARLRLLDAAILHLIAHRRGLRAAAATDGHRYPARSTWPVELPR